jgi:CRP/FNR family transcriptional regulator
MKSTKPDIVSTLRRLPLFADLAEAELNLIAQGVNRTQIEKGAVIFVEGDVCHELLVVEEGEVKLTKSASNGRQQLLAIERKGSALAEVAVLDGGRYPATAEAISATSVLRLSADRFRRICVNNPEMALNVFKVLARKLRHLVGLVEELSFSTVRARLIAYLVRLAEERGEQTSKGVQFRLTENNEELAARLGTVRELVSRNLGRLHADGLIHMNKRIVNIPDMTLLRDETGRPG